MSGSPGLAAGEFLTQPGYRLASKALVVAWIADGPLDGMAQRSPPIPGSAEAGLGGLE